MRVIVVEVLEPDQSVLSELVWFFGLLAVWKDLQLSEGVEAVGDHFLPFDKATLLHLGVTV